MALYDNLMKSEDEETKQTISHLKLLCVEFFFYIFQIRSEHCCLLSQHKQWHQSRTFSNIMHGGFNAT